MFREEDYFSLYKKVRNKFRIYRYYDIVGLLLSYMHAPAKDDIDVLQRQPWLMRKNLLAGSRKTFGIPKMHLPIVDNEAIQFRVVGGTWDMAFGDMDDLRAALANFVFKVIIIGTVDPIIEEKKKQKILTGRYKVTINEVGIYVRDSYDFNDPPGEDQELGNWDFDDDSVGRTLFNGGTTVNNSDFRKWRDANGKGGDFLVYSDIKYVKLNPADTFEFKK